ncbi:MAG: exodeoxyribonuclease III, partial [Acidobacteriaceae bacterium]|nr:exodeoxyribonuclease III [Acidobacteriaceae bacterium]
MKIATWNVNGIRARQAQLQVWLEREHPDVLCLQEIKAAPDQIPADLCDIEGYWGYWHGGKGYSGVALLISKTFAPERPTFEHPGFDFEHRIATTTVNGVTVASVYVPNGGKDFNAKVQFLEALDAYAATLDAADRTLVLCGDLNVTRTEQDVHPKERKPSAIGQRPEERALLARILARGLVDVGRALEPDNDNLFTWWAPWRQMRERNIGWRIDYVLASRRLASTARASVVEREYGTSDHAPVTM